MIELLNIDCIEKKPKGFQKGHKLQKWRGRKHTEATKQKMREAKLKNNPMHNPKVVVKRSATLIRNKTFAKENSNNWKGGITPDQILARNSKEYKIWREIVFVRDGYKCMDCGVMSAKGVNVFLHTHHIKRFAKYPELRFEPSNGLTLCKGCHKKEHKNNG